MIDQPLVVGFAGEHFDPGHEEHVSAARCRFGISAVNVPESFQHALALFPLKFGVGVGYVPPMVLIGQLPVLFFRLTDAFERFIQELT